MTDGELLLADGGRTMRWSEDERRAILLYFAQVADEEASEDIC